MLDGCLSLWHLSRPRICTETSRAVEVNVELQPTPKRGQAARTCCYLVFSQQKCLLWRLSILGISLEHSRSNNALISHRTSANRRGGESSGSSTTIPKAINHINTWTLRTELVIRHSSNTCTWEVACLSLGAPSCPSLLSLSAQRQRGNRELIKRKRNLQRSPDSGLLPGADEAQKSDLEYSNSAWN